ncbi:transposase family protein [Geodermatophilus obscurus]|uniref:transposase family protein n=1 Tax=Geodermatophilus obscurus TaxID=1861 RepID=UPI0009D684FF
MAHACADGQPTACLDGTVLSTDRVAARAEGGHHLWYSGKPNACGGSVQVPCDPGGFPLWVSAVRPGSTHNLTAAREPVLPARRPHAARGLPVLADEGLHRRGRRRARAGQAPPGPLHTDNRCYTS